MHTAVAQLLMRAVELRGDDLVDGQLALPESHNGLPDLLDEALWSLEAWKALQERDGGVRAGVESHREPWGYYFANDDPLPYWTFARDADVSARVAALFAHASRLLTPRDRARAADLRGRALGAWRWARSHRPHAASRLYAASELWRLTGDRAYAREVDALWPSFGPDGPWSRMALQHAFQSDYFADARPMPDWVLGYLGASAASPARVADSRRILEAYAAAAVREAIDSRHAHRSPRGDRGVDWGGGAIVARYLDPVVARMQLGDVPDDRRADYFDALSLAADYVLGGNPLGMSFVTGLGSRRPEEPLHLDSLVFVRRGRPPMPGIPVFGPVRELPSAPYYRAARAAFHPPFEDRPLMRRYADVRTFPNTNEFTVWDGQAPLAQLFALLVGAGARPPATWLPGAPAHASPLPE
jgi:endoglucanase